MADSEPKRSESETNSKGSEAGGVVNVVARTVGSALGTAVSTAGHVVDGVKAAVSEKTKPAPRAASVKSSDQPKAPKQGRHATSSATKADLARAESKRKKKAAHRRKLRRSNTSG